MRKHRKQKTRAQGLMKANKRRKKRFSPYSKTTFEREMEDPAFKEAFERGYEEFLKNEGRISNSSRSS